LSCGLAAIARTGLGLGPARIRWLPVPLADWRESWKRHFSPRLIGGRLLVRPSWSPSRPGPGQVEIVLDPGLSFGTGQHPTTDYCLSEVVRLRPRGIRRSLWDVGTGSGILAIAAAKLGFGPIEAWDLDPSAVRVAGQNALENRVRDLVKIL